MIKKFQLGGKLQEALMLFVLGLALTLKADPNLVVQIAQQNPEALEAAVQTYQLTLDMNQAAQTFQQVLQLKTQAARRGAKLQYLKSLKHQCADDEEVYYYKKGGSVGCGCKKKEDGGEVAKAKCGSAIEKFKKAKKGMKAPQIKDLAAKDSIEINSAKGNDELEANRPGSYKPNPKHNPKDPNSRTHIWVPDRTKAPYNKKDKKEKGGEIKKNCGGSAIAKFKAAKCGTKMKKHLLGGSLNGIPFYQGGTNKGGITEKSDNTKVERIPNKGEGVYEEIPVNGWDFIPAIGTYREARRLDQGDPNASVTRLGISLAGDLTGAGMIGSVAKAAGKASRIQKALKARGYQLFTKDGSLWFRLPKKIIRGYGDKLYTYEIPNIYGGSSFKTIPTVDYTSAAMAPLVLTLRVPAEAPFFNYSK